MLAGALYRMRARVSFSTAATAAAGARRLAARPIQRSTTRTLTLASAQRLQQHTASQRGLSTAAAAATSSSSSAATATAASASSSSSISSLQTTYDFAESIRLVRAMCVRSFDESILVNMHLNVDPRKPNQMVRGLAQLPHGSGKQTIVAVFARGERAFEAKQAGADIVGENDLAEKILAGNIEFTRCIATPDMMPVVSKVARILGPKGLMPNPKTGTVTHAVGAAVQSAKQGQVEFKTDKDGTLKAPVGKASFPPDKLAANIAAFVKAVLDAKPSGAKSVYLKKAFLVGSMTPAVEMDLRGPPFKTGSQTTAASAAPGTTTATPAAPAAATKA